MLDCIHSLRAFLAVMPLGDACTRAEGLAREEWLRRALGGLDGAEVTDGGVVDIQGTAKEPKWPARRLVVHRPAGGVTMPERSRRLALTRDEDGEWVLLG